MKATPVILVLAAAVALGEDGRVARRARAAVAARAALEAVAQGGTPTPCDGDLEVRVHVAKDRSVAWVDVLDARMVKDPLAALLAHRSTRRGGTTGSFDVRDASL